MGKAVFKILALAALVAAVEYFFGWSEIFSSIERAAKARENGEAEFLLAMSAGCAFGLPLSLCYLASGAAFGFAKGWALCAAGLATSGALGFCLGRVAVPKKFADSLREKFKIPRAPNGRAMFNINFFVRAVPGIPYWAQNVSLGAARTGFGLYMAVNIAVQGAIAGAMNFLGSSAAHGGAEKYAAFAVLAAVLAAFHISANIAYKKSAKKSADKKSRPGERAGDC